MTYRRCEFCIAAALSSAALVVYAATLSPTVNFIDSGELATDIYTLGISHPTGYPLFTMLGYLFTHIPLGMRVIAQANLMAAILCAVGLFFFFRFLLFLLSVVGNKSFVAQRDPSSEVTRDQILQLFVPAAAATLFLAFSETYWSQAVAIEVYSLHLFFLCVLLFIFTKIGVAESTGGMGNASKVSWQLFAFVLGLSFTNHMTTILLAPAFLAGFFWMNRITSPGTWKKLRSQVLPFLLGLSAYLYLPVRASTKPPMNWGNPVDLERFLWHFSGKVYRVWIFSSFESAGKQFTYFLNSLPGEFAYVPLLIAGAGIWWLFRTNRPVLCFTALLFLGCLGYSINYDIHDIDSYFLLAYVSIAIWCGFGASALIRNRKAQQLSIAAGLAVVAMFVAVENYHKVDESSSTLVEEYTRDMLRSVAPNGILLTYQWDYFVSAAYYFQLVEHLRPDVVIIDKELLRRTWYLEQLEHRYPALTLKSEAEIDAFKKELYKFEHGLPYNSSAVEYRYAQVMRSFFEKNISERPVYVSPEIEPEYSQGFERIPSGLVFRLSKGKDDVPLAEPAYSYRVPGRGGTYVDGILSFYAQSYLNYGIYANLNGMKEEAKNYVEKALAVNPAYEQALAWKARLNQP